MVQDIIKVHGCTTGKEIVPYSTVLGYPLWCLQKLDI